MYLRSHYRFRTPVFFTSLWLFRYFDLAELTPTYFTSFIQIPVVCGGREIYRGDSHLCYTYEPYLDSWKPAGALLVPRHEAGCAVASDYGLVISGGFDDLETVEYTGNDCS